MIATLGGRFLQYVLMFVTLKVSTTLLEPSEMAKLYLVNSAFVLAAMIFINPMGLFINRRLHSWSAIGRAQEYLRYFWIFLLVIGIVTFCFVYFFLQENFLLPREDPLIFALMVVGTLIAITVNQTVIPGLNLMGSSGLFISFTVLNSIIALLASYGLIVLLGAKAEYWLCGLIFSNSFVAALAWRYFYNVLGHKNLPVGVTVRQMNLLLNFSIPISFAVGLGWLQSHSYRFLMESELGLADLGLFAAGYGISASLVGAFESVFITHFQPSFYRRIISDKALAIDVAWKSYASAIIPSLYLLCCLIYGLAGPLTRTLLGDDYQSSAQFVVFGVIVEMARVISGVYGMLAQAHMKTRLLVIPNIVGAFLAIALVWLLMPIYKSDGVGAGLIFSSFVSVFLIYVTTHRRFGIKLPRRLILNGVLMGITLICISKFMQWLVLKNGGLIDALIVLTVVGIFYLFFQYKLIQPHLALRLKE